MTPITLGEYNWRHLYKGEWHIACFYCVSHFLRWPPLSKICQCVNDKSQFRSFIDYVYGIQYRWLKQWRKVLMMKYIIVSSYLNNVSILQDGRHSEPLFEKWLSVNKFSKMVKSHRISFVFIQILSTPIYCTNHDPYILLNQILI